MQQDDRIAGRSVAGDVTCTVHAHVHAVGVGGARLSVLLVRLPRRPHLIAVQRLHVHGLARLAKLAAAEVADDRLWAPWCI